MTTENRLAACRRFYNDAVTVLADRTGTLPGLLLEPLVVPDVPPLLTFELHGLPVPSALTAGVPASPAPPAAEEAYGGPVGSARRLLATLVRMSKKTAKRKLRSRRNKANHGRKPNAGRG